MAASGNDDDGLPVSAERHGGPNEGEARRRDPASFWNGLASAIAFTALGSIAMTFVVGGATGSGNIVYSIVGLVSGVGAVALLATQLVNARRRRDGRFVAGLMTGFGIFLLLIGLCVAQ